MYPFIDRSLLSSPIQKMGLTDFDDILAVVLSSDDIENAVRQPTPVVNELLNKTSNFHAIDVLADHTWKLHSNTDVNHMSGIHVWDAFKYRLELNLKLPGVGNIVAWNVDDMKHVPKEKGATQKKRSDKDGTSKMYPYGGGEYVIDDLGIRRNGVYTPVYEIKIDRVAKTTTVHEVEGDHVGNGHNIHIEGIKCCRAVRKPLFDYIKLKLDDHFFRLAHHNTKKFLLQYEVDKYHEYRFQDRASDTIPSKMLLNGHEFAGEADKSLFLWAYACGRMPYIIHSKDSDIYVIAKSFLNDDHARRFLSYPLFWHRDTVSHIERHDKLIPVGTDYTYNLSNMVMITTPAYQPYFAQGVGVSNLPYRYIQASMILSGNDFIVKNKYSGRASYKIILKWVNKIKDRNLLDQLDGNDEFIDTFLGIVEFAAKEENRDLQDVVDKFQFNMLYYNCDWGQCDGFFNKGDVVIGTDIVWKWGNMEISDRVASIEGPGKKRKPQGGGGGGDDEKVTPPKKTKKVPVSQYNAMRRAQLRGGVSLSSSSSDEVTVATSSSRPRPHPRRVLIEEDLDEDDDDQDDTKRQLLLIGSSPDDDSKHSPEEEEQEEDVEMKGPLDVFNTPSTQSPPLSTPSPPREHEDSDSIPGNQQAVEGYSQLFNDVQPEAEEEEEEGDGIGREPDSPIIVSSVSEQVEDERDPDSPIVASPASPVVSTSRLRTPPAVTDDESDDEVMFPLSPPL